MNKKILSAFLCASMAVQCVSVPVLANSAFEEGTGQTETINDAQELQKTSQTKAAIAAQGMIGTAKWTIDANGTLTIGAGEFVNTDEFFAWPWLDGDLPAIRQIDGTARFKLSGDASWAFRQMYDLELIDLSGWDTSSVISMKSMFHDCPYLKSIKFGKWNTSSVQDMSAMFYGCSALKELDLNSWNTSKVKSMMNMFESCVGLTNLKIGDWDTSSVETMEQMFYSCTALPSLEIGGWNVANVQNMDEMFKNCESLESLMLKDWNTSRVDSMIRLFENCPKLRSLDVSGWNTSRIQDMDALFYNCMSLNELDVHNWDMSSVTTASEMFGYCSSLQKLDLNSWNTSKFMHIVGMFAECTKLSSLKIDQWDTSHVVSMNDMFRDCMSLEELDLSDWNTSSVEYMDSLFSGCTNLRNVYLANWDTSSVLFMDFAFYNCTSLLVLDLKNWDLTSEPRTESMFDKCSSLYKVRYSAKGEKLLALLPEARWYQNGKGPYAIADLPSIGRKDIALLVREDHADEKDDPITPPSKVHLPKGYSFPEDSLPFANYGEKIPRSYYTKLFEKGPGKALYNKYESGLSGRCIEFAQVTTSIYNDLPGVSSFSGGFPPVDPVIMHDLNRKHEFKANYRNVSLEDYITYAYLTQYGKQILDERIRNIDQAQNLLHMVKGLTTMNKIGLIIEMFYETGGGHSVVAVGYDGNDILVDDSNSLDKLERITIHDDGSWEFSGPTSSTELNSKTGHITYFSNYTQPYHFLLTGKPITPSDPKSVFANTDQEYEWEPLNPESSLLCIDTDAAYSIHEEVTPIKTCDIPDANASDPDMYWVDDSSSVSISAIEGKDNHLEFANDSTILESSTDSITDYKAIINEDVQTLSFTGKPHDDFEVAMSSVLADGEVKLSIQGTSQKGQIRLEATEGGVQAAGFKDGTIRLWQNDELVAEESFVDNDELVNIDYDKDGNDTALDTDASGDQTPKTSIENAKVQGLEKYYVFTGKAIQPDVTVQLNGKTLKKDSDYTVYFENNIQCGTARVVVEGSGAYTGKLSRSFTIVEKVPMYRMYNPNSSEHHYTSQAKEREVLVKIGWDYEGLGWIAPGKSETPVYRLYNKNAGDHHYTKNAQEKNMLVKLGWDYEGIGWYSDDQMRVPLYRQYNPNAKKAGSHNYTRNKKENDALVKLGWKEEGIGWYGAE